MLASCLHCCLFLGSQSSVLSRSIALCLVTPASRLEVAAHPWSCRATRHYQLVPSTMGGCYEPSCDILPQPSAPASLGRWRLYITLWCRCGPFSWPSLDALSYYFYKSSHDTTWLFFCVFKDTSDSIAMVFPCILVVSVFEG
jgi:hypothetical protein